MIQIEYLQNDALSQACRRCHLGKGCCFEARPPLIQKRIELMLASGVETKDMESKGYKRLKLKPDGFCVMFENGNCRIHAVKPETCAAGPFTFDVRDSMVEIFLKKESICLMVGCLKENSDAYNALFEVAVGKIMDLIRDLPPEELAEILKIEEPETELVAQIKLEEKRL